MAATTPIRTVGDVNESLRDLLRSGGDPESLARLGVTPDDLVDLCTSTPIGVDGAVADEEITIGTIAEAAGLEEPLAHAQDHGWSIDVAVEPRGPLSDDGDDMTGRPTWEATEIEIAGPAGWADDVFVVAAEEGDTSEAVDELVTAADHDPEPEI